jgi:YfiH family protein
MPKLLNIEYDFVVEPKGLTRPLYQQVHGNALVEVTEDNLSYLYQNPPEADGAVTSANFLKLSVFTADCLPLLFFTEDPKGPIAAIHCGWKGAKQSIATHIETLWSDYMGKIHVILGPCIGPCCFEVKEDLVQAFLAEGHSIEPYLKRKEGKIFFHLSSFVQKEHLSFISQTHIHTQQLRCTYCSSPSLPSYRRNKGTDPRIKGWIIKSL